MKIPIKLVSFLSQVGWATRFTVAHQIANHLRPVKVGQPKEVCPPYLTITGEV